MTQTITSAWLRKQQACPECVALFEATFGPRADVTAKTRARAVEAGLDLVWLASHVLTDAAWAKYERAMDAAWAKYERVTVPAYAEYVRVRDAAWAAYKRARNAALVSLLLDDANWREGWEA